MSDALLDRYTNAAKEAGLPRELFQLYLQAGIVLQPKQLQFAAACALCDHRGGPVEIGFGGARGGGKSHAGLSVLAVDCLRYAGLTCLLLRKVGKANRENFNELRRKVLRGVHTVWKQQEGILLFDNGSKIVLGHFQNERDIDAYLGLEYDVILVEEATTLSGSKYRAVRTCNRSSKPGWRPRMYSTTNPGGVGHAWYKQKFITPFKRREEKDTRFIPSTVNDNACVNEEYRKVLDNLTGWQKQAWLYGDWDIAAGQFFTNWRQDVHVLKVSEMPTFIPGTHKSWASLDYGFTHYTTAYPFFKVENGLYVPDEHAERRWLPDRHTQGIVAMLDRCGMNLKALDTFVAGHDVFAQKGDEKARTIADQYEDLGIKLRKAKVDRITGASEVLRRLGDLEAENKIEPTLFISERCVHLIECIPALEHDPHRPEDVLKVDTDDDGIGGDDPYDGLRYGVMEDHNGANWDVLATIYGEDLHAGIEQDRDHDQRGFSELEPASTLQSDSWGNW